MDMSKLILKYALLTVLILEVVFSFAIFSLADKEVQSSAARQLELLK